MDQTGVTQHIDVLHDAEACEVRKRLHDLRRGPGARPQQIQNRPPGRIRKGLPDGVEFVSHQLRLAAIPCEQSLAMVSIRCFHPVLTPALWAGSRNPIARWCRLSLVPPGISSNRTFMWLIAG